MKIPTAHQIFDTPVILTDKDAERLAPWLVSEPKLCAVLTGISEPDLRRLVVLELSGAKRYSVLRRLVARFGMCYRKRIARSIAKLL